MIKKVEVQALKEKISYLEGIIDGTIKAWKARHPEDFIPPSNYKKYPDDSQEIKPNTILDSVGESILFHRNSKLLDNNNLDKTPDTLSKGCGKPIHIGACHFVACGESGYNKDLWLCDDCLSTNSAPLKEKSEQ